MRLTFNESKLSYKYQVFDLKHPIKDAIQYGDFAIVIFDFNYYFKTNNKSNCQAFDLSKDAERIWIAKLPIIENDSYVSFFKNKTLWSWSCYRVQIDFKTGEIVNKAFGK